MTALSRRAFLGVGGTLVVGFVTRDAIAQHAPTKLPGSLASEPHLSGWVRIAPDGAVTVFTGKAELGQGIRTALLQVAAEQLDLSPSQITLVTADTGRTPNEGYTAGSHSMQDSGTAIMHATAELRAILVQEAASRWTADPAALTTAGGQVHSADGRSLTYGELVASLDPDRLVTPGVVLKSPDTYSVMGKPMGRVDIPAKVSGGAAYVQDMRLPGMVHARAIRPPRYGATLASLDGAAIEAMAGRHQAGPRRKLPGRDRRRRVAGHYCHARNRAGGGLDRRADDARAGQNLRHAAVPAVAGYGHPGPQSRDPPRPSAPCARVTCGPMACMVRSVLPAPWRTWSTAS